MSDAGQRPPELRELRLSGESLPIEKEYRAIEEAMRRCERNVDAFDAKAYDPAAIDAARAMWAVRMAAEYRSTSVFSAMAAQAMEAGASLDAIAVILRMAQDEIRHAEICGRVVVALGGAPRARMDVPRAVQSLSRHPGCAPEERAMRNIVYGCCLSEVVNAARFVDSIDTMSDPFLRDATRLLLADERLHGQFGFHYLEAWSDWLEAHGEVRASMTRYLRHAFAVLEQQLSGVGAPPKELGADHIALGIIDPKRLPESFYPTVEGAIVPGLERFGIDAGAAWRTRTLARASGA